MSGEAETSRADQDLRALEDFLVGNRDLEQLEALLDRFNLFEATGFVRQELRHSDFLAFLLDPKGNHELGGAFIERLLRRVLALDGDTPVPMTSTELEQWDLSRMEVRREWQYVDILLLDEGHELAVIIENKIGTGEHDNQLPRYLDVVGQHFPGWRIVPLYLTPDGDPPSHGSYLPVSYRLVCDVIDGLAEDLSSVVDPNLKVALEQYSDLLRRNVLTDSDVAKLCRTIYQDHKRALDLIFAHRPNPQSEIGELLLRLIDDSGRVVPKRRVKKPYIYFYPTEWGISPYGPLDFVFHNLPNTLELFLEVGWKNEEARRRLFDVARMNESLFNDFMEKPGSRLNPKLYRRTFLRPEFYEEASDSDREEEIRRVWAEFLNDDLPRIDAALKGEGWIWESDEPDEGHSGRGERFRWGDGDIEITRRLDESQD